MRFKLSTLLLGVLLWMFCTHSLSFASILTASTFSIPSTHTSFQSTIRDSLNTEKTNSVLTMLRKDRNASVIFGDEVIRKMDRLETNIGWSGIHVEKDSPAHGQLIENAADEEGIGQVKAALIAAKASKHLLNNHCQKISPDKTQCSKYLTQLKMTGTSLDQICKSQNKKCSPDDLLSKYRSIDGSCNHIENGTWGKSFTAYRRVVFPEYHDGISTPKKSDNKKQLTSARVISVKLIKDMDKKDESLTMAFMQWSQFISHDLAHTASSKMLFSSHSVMCCDNNGNSLAPRYIHPFCMPVAVPSDDPFYSRYRVTCMSYVRSLPALSSDCTFGPVNQMNQVTHYLDGSQIYGSTLSKSRKLREFKGGRLSSSSIGGRKFLPMAAKPQDDCQVVSDKSDCYRAGDIRVNMQPHLTAMHVLWLREHNRIAGVLQELNKHWDDERLYQETRKIVNAEIQHITYNEWVPVLLGEKYAKKFYATEFNEYVDPTVSNSFATAAIRFTNSLVASFLKVYDEARNSSEVLRLHEHFNKPEVLEEPGKLDGLVRGLATQSCQKVDLDVVSDVTEKLYAPGRIGFDALSLDIQRGRDHGLPGYTDYRQFCGLTPVKNFDDLKDFISAETINTLRTLYTTPSDIDLLVGGLAEKPFFDSLLGPTFTCLVAEQLMRTKQGDRHFYTHMGRPWSLNQDQLAQVKKSSLAAVFCDNGDDIRNMQEQVFNVIDDRNKLQECNSIPKLDLSFWREIKKE